MDRFNRKSFQLGEDTFFVQLIPPKESIKAWTEIQKILFPAISGAMEGAKLTADTEEACNAQADAILAFAQPDGYPVVKDNGTPAGTGSADSDWLSVSSKIG